MLRLLLKDSNSKEKERHTGTRVPLLFLSVCLLLATSACAPVDSYLDGIQRTYVDSLIGVPKDVKSISGDKLAYNLLDDGEQRCYDEILDCILSHDSEAALSVYDEKQVAKIYEAVFADYGGLFWINGYSYRTYADGDDNSIGFLFMPTYTMTREERDGLQLQIDAVAEEWLSEYDGGGDDYSKARFVYETLTQKADYDAHADNNQNILSVFLGGRTVCQGYSDAAVYLFNRLSIPSMIVSGSVNDQPHAWNLVQLDGEYYYMDVTWGNGTYRSENSGYYGKHTDYTYLNITSEEITRTHTIANMFDVPKCDGTTDNFYRREGLFYDSFDEPSIGRLIGDAYNAGAEYVSFKLKDGELLDEVRDFYIDSENIFYYCSGLTSVHYMADEDMNVFTVVFP